MEDTNLVVMKKSIIFVIIFIFAASMLVESTDDLCTLTLKILNNKHCKPIYIAIYDNHKSFLNPKKAKYAYVVDSNKEDIYIIENISPGDYAVAIFQDINGNGKIDTFFFGIPKEPYGFSNNARKLMGPPSFKDCKFQIANDTRIEIKLR